MKSQILAVPLSLLLSLPAHAQNLPQPAPAANGSDEIRRLIAGDKFPLTLKLKDIDTGWRRISVGTQTDAPATARTTIPTDLRSHDDFAALLISMFGGGPDVYLTKGVTVKEGTDSFLVAYRVRLDRQAVQEFEDSFPKNAPSPSQAQVLKIIEAFVQERPIDLALLNLSMVGRVSDIRPFRFQDQMTFFNTRIKNQFAKDNERMIESRNSSSVHNMKQLGRALQQYITDNNEVLPSLETTAAAKKALMPYAKTELVFFYPNQASQLYRPNPTLSGRKMAHLENYKTTLVAFYEAAPASDGTRAVLFLDGRIKRINESEWPQLKKASRIP